ncbi:MAG TPA: thioredoxin-like domain-containing protein, partial [Chroococcales cyanobacterium]
MWSRTKISGNIAPSRSLTAALSILFLSALSSHAQLGAGRPAPELTGGGSWVNLTKPIALKDLRGKAVLLDFWTDSCINCLHSIPKLKALESKYGKSLVVVSVHSAKYENEKSDCAVRTAVSKLGLTNPVLNDPESAVWLKYGVEYWPTFILIDAKGDIVGQTIGDTQFNRLDTAVGTVVAQAKKAGILDDKNERYHVIAEPANKKTLRYPEKIVADQKRGSLYIADSGHNRILAVKPDGNLVNTFGTGKAGNADGSASQAQFSNPQGLAVADDKLYVA